MIITTGNTKVIKYQCWQLNCRTYREVWPIPADMIGTVYGDAVLVCPRCGATMERVEGEK